MRRLFAAVAVLCVSFASLAYASHHHRHHHHHHHRPLLSYRHHRSHHHGARYAITHGGGHTASLSSQGRPADCYGIPWCGCYLRHLLGVASTAYNLAREWVHYGHATTAHVGAVVVWAHHVGKIVGGSPGHWEVLSGNDGHRVRTRVRSVAGAIAFRE
jgi:hypothetical protein